MTKQVLVPVLLALLAGCVSMQTSWAPTDGAGPYLSGTAHARVFRRCEQKLMDGAPQCAIAFEDEAGNKLEVFHDLIGQLDGLLLTVPGASGWARTASSPVSIKVPYKLFLVTLSPIVIVAVPAPPSATEPCWVDAPRGDCLRSYLASGNGYSLATTIPIVSGTLWLSPAANSADNLVPVGVDEYRLALKGINAKLLRQGANWTFVRAPASPQR